MHTDRPNFSIITPAYQSAATLAATIDSVLAQTDPDWELIVVDDGSTDDTLGIARGFAERDERIRVLTQPNGRTSVARNHAMREARGAWFVFIDADDTLAPTYLEEQRRFIAEHPGHGIYATNAWVCHSNGMRHLFWTGRHNRVYSISLAEELRRNRINVHSTIPREVYERVGEFRPGIQAQDYEYWLRALLAGFTHIMNPRPLVDYHMVDGSVSTNQVGMIESVMNTITRLSTTAPKELTPAFEDSLRIWAGRLEIARMQNRMMDGEYAGARSTFVRNARYLPDWRKIPVGGALVLVSPALYRRVLLRRFERSRALPHS